MKLTPREKDVLELVCDGLTSKAIAHELGISEQAVKAHVSRLFRKFGVTNRAGLVQAASKVRDERRQAISDRYRERARGLDREVTRLRRENTRLARSASAKRSKPKT